MMSIAAGTALLAQAPADLTVCVGKGYTLTSTKDATGTSPVTYQWYEDGEPLPGANSASYSIAAGREAGEYAYWRIAANADCPTGVPSNTFTVRVKPIPIISCSGGDASQIVIQDNAITTIVYTASDGATISKTSDFPADISDVAVGSSYTISGKTSELGTYGYSLTASVDGVDGCTSAVAAGTITVTIAPPPGNTPSTLCLQCCYDGAAWVDCYVTTYAYQFANASNDATVIWNGSLSRSNAGSRWDGRANTAVIASAGTTAVQLCKNLGTEWYLPAIEELYAMGSGPANANSNNRPGADLLATPSGYYWSSTEATSAFNRCGGGQNEQVCLYYGGGGGVTYGRKDSSYYVRCAWRP
jgi:hypothetical protein